MQYILDELAANDGACLWWQMATGREALLAVAAGTLRMVSDLVIHPDAIEIEAGMAYAMPKTPCQHRDDGRGQCIDCGKFIA